MLLQSLLSGALFAGLAVAQTPPGFAPEVKDRLDLIFGTKVVTVPGTSLTKAGECCIWRAETLHRSDHLSRNCEAARHWND